MAKIDIHSMRNIRMMLRELRRVANIQKDMLDAQKKLIAKLNGSFKSKDSSLFG